MKQRMLRVVATLSCWALVAGCSVTTTDTPGVFVANVEGTYDLAVITNTIKCTPYFAPLVTVIQDGEHFTLLAETTGYDDLLGVFDEGEESTYTLSGAGGDCTGSFVSDTLSQICEVNLVTCVTDATGEETCSEQKYTCELTYERRS